MNIFKTLIFLALTVIGFSSCGFESAQPWNDPKTDFGITNKPVSANLVNKIINPYEDGQAEELYLFEHKILIEKNQTGSTKFVFKFFEFKQRNSGTIKRTFIVTKSTDGQFALNSSTNETGTWGPSDDGKGLELISENGEKWKLNTRENSLSALDYDYFDKDNILIQSGELSMRPTAKLSSINGIFGSTACRNAVVKLGYQLFAERTFANLSQAEDLMSIADAKYSLLIFSLNKKVRSDLPKIPKKKMNTLAQTKMGQESISYSKGMLKKGVLSDKVCSVYGNSKPGDCEDYLIKEGLTTLSSYRTLKKVLSNSDIDVSKAIAKVKEMTIREQSDVIAPIFQKFIEEHNQIIDPKCASSIYENAIKSFLTFSETGELSFDQQGQLKVSAEVAEKCSENSSAKEYVKLIVKDVKKQIQETCVL